MIMPEIIRREIKHHGIVTFARFMELALYYPDFGYYETKKSPGRSGDFYTSVSAGELFGQLLAFQFAEWLESAAKNQKSEIGILETGAHDGRLAKDILDWLQLNRPQLFSNLEYIILEPSPRRRDWQKKNLKDIDGHIRWVSEFNDSTIQRFN